MDFKVCRFFFLFLRQVFQIMYCNIIAALNNLLLLRAEENYYLDKNYNYVQKRSVGVITLRGEIEKDIALNTAAFLPRWRQLKHQQSQWYLFHEPCRLLLPWFEPPFHSATSVRAIFRATDYSKKNLKHLFVLQAATRIDASRSCWSSQLPERLLS